MQLTESRKIFTATQDSPLVKFGKVIQIIRKGRDLKVSDVAGKSGLQEEMINNLETGNIVFEEVMNSLPKLAEALKISKGTLLKVLLNLGEITDFDC